MLKRALLSACLFALLVVLPPQRVEATVISAPFVTVAVGDTFLIPISITDAADLAFTDNFTRSCLAASRISARAPALREVIARSRILGKRTSKRI